MGGMGRTETRTRITRAYRLRKIAAGLCCEGGCHDHVAPGLKWRCRRHQDEQNRRSNEANRRKVVR